MIKSYVPNQACLIRPILGRLEGHTKYRSFSLRNYPLHLDQIEELALDGILNPGSWQRSSPKLYWKAQVDANDVEFVLASPSEDRPDLGH